MPILPLAILLAAAWPPLVESNLLQDQKPPSVKELGREASQAQQRGEFQLAADLFRRIVEAAPENQAAWAGLANALKSLGRLEEAAEAFSKVAAMGGDMGASARCLLAVLLSKKQDIDGALRELDQAFKDASPDLRPQLAQAAREDPDFEPLRNHPRFREIVGLPLDPTVPSPVRDFVYGLVCSLDGSPLNESPSDLGILPDGRALLYLDRQDYNHPESPFLISETDCSGTWPQTRSFEEFRDLCRTRLHVHDGASERWSKARLCSQLLGLPVGVLPPDRLFVVFYDTGVSLLEDRVVSIIDLLLKQKAGSKKITRELLSIDTSGLLRDLRAASRPAASISGQFEILFGYDPFALTAHTASHALHAKGLVKDPRSVYDVISDKTMQRTFHNDLFRIRSSLEPGAVLASWPPRLDVADLQRVEATAREILSAMRETETLFMTAFPTIALQDHETAPPTTSESFWEFFLRKDWDWWKQPQLVALLKEGQIDGAAVVLFGLEGQMNNPDRDFGGAWQSYFETLNGRLRHKMTYTLEQLAWEQAAINEEKDFIAEHPDRRDAIVDFARRRGTVQAAIQCWRANPGESRDEALRYLSQWEWIGTRYERSAVLEGGPPSRFGLRFQTNGVSHVLEGNDPWRETSAYPDRESDGLSSYVYSPSGLRLYLTEMDGELALQGWETWNNKIASVIILEPAVR